jgi:ATP-dependent DNA ligase
MEDGRRLITAHGAGLTAWAASSMACPPGLALARAGSALPPHGPAVVQAAMLPVRPCLPTFARFPPPGPDWLHEIKHDGYRMLALRDGERVRLVSRYGVDWTHGFPAVVAAVEALAARNCLIDGEVIACDGDGLADFQLLRRRQHADPACAFDLLGLDGHDLRCQPIEERKAELARLLVDCRPELALNRVFDGPGPVVFERACTLGCEGIVSKRHGSRYATGRTRDWLTVTNPAALAVPPRQEGRKSIGADEHAHLPTCRR